MFFQMPSVPGMMEASMKKRFFLVFFLMTSIAGLAGAAEFGYPVGGEPWYFIKAAFGDGAALSKGPWRVSQVAVNGTRARDFLLFQGGKEVLGNDIQGQQPFEVKVRFSWVGNRPYEIQARLENAKTKSSTSLQAVYLDNVNIILYYLSIVKMFW